jgi:formylglycine-generating enzyme required for sulfatase activity
MYGITTGGEKKIILKPQKAFAANIGSYANFNVKLTVSATPANGSEVVYKIFDLNAKTVDPVTRNELKNGKYGDYETDFARIGNGFNTTLSDVLIWTAVTNGTEYKTDKLVMRKIPAADVEWTIGSPVGEPGRDYVYEGGCETQHRVKLTEDYFIGVFEMTQSQALKVWATINGTDTSEHHFSTFPDSDLRPYTGMTFNSIRGFTSWAAHSADKDAYPKINWPTNSPMHSVFYNRFAGKLRSMFRNYAGTDFDLPTSAQWEFACRAGTSTGLNSGNNITVADARCPNVDEIAWNKYSDYSDVDGGTNQTRAVGLKKPNAFGLYDMHGNAEEQCLDVHAADISVFYDGEADSSHTSPLVDPVGPTWTTDGNPQRTLRGGSYTRSNRYIRSGYRDGGGHTTQSQHKAYVGFRMVMPVADTGWIK